jgi:hypothetical protein
MYLPGGRASGLSARLTRGDLQFATPGSTGKIYNANPAAFGWREQKIFFCDVFGFKIRSRMSRKKRLSSDEAIHALGLEKPSEFPIVGGKNWAGRDGPAHVTIRVRYEVSVTISGAATGRGGISTRNILVWLVASAEMLCGLPLGISSAWSRSITALTPSK